MDDPQNMTSAELRAEAARILESLNTVSTIRRKLVDEYRAVAPLLLQGDKALRASEGVVTPYGTVKKHTITKGRAWVVKEEIDKDAGELGDYAPKPDERVVIEHLSEMPTAMAAELRLRAALEDSPVVISDKTKYPTVAELRKAFGPDTKYVGSPPKEHHIVLAKGEGDDEILLGPEGML